MYTLIVYKSNSADYCMNCLMESFDSDMDILFFNTKDKLIQCIAEYIYKNSQMERGESKYIMVVLENGIPYGEKEEDWTELEDLNGYASFELDYRDELYKNANGIAQLRIEDEKKQKIVDDEKKKNEKLKLKDEQERQEYERLKKRFDGD